MMSDSPRHYIAQFGESQEIKTAKIYGHEIKDEKEEQPVSPVHCESCEKWTTRGLDHCIWCSHPVGEEVQTLTESIENPHKDGADLLVMIMNGEVDAEDLRAAKKLEPVIKTRPGFWERIDDLIEVAERYEDEEDQSPVAVGPGGVVAWGSAWISRAVARWVAIRDSILRLHPQYEHYPPSPSRAAAGGVAIAAWILFMSTVIVPDVANGVLTGEPSSVGMLLFGVLVVGAYAVNDLPTMEDLAA
jgi:hypothetical protein